MSSKLKLFAQTKYIDLTTPNFKSLADFEKVYKGQLLPKPYVSSLSTTTFFINRHLKPLDPTQCDVHICREPLIGRAILNLAIRGWQDVTLS